jgi:hypothetical protein
MKLLASLALALFLFQNAQAFEAAEAAEAPAPSNTAVPSTTDQKSPMQITVGKMGPIESRNYYTYNFGNVQVNYSAYQYFYLRNIGNYPITLYGVYISGTSYWARTNCPPVLNPGFSCTTQVEFRPWYEGYFPGRLRFQLNTGSEIVDLYGWGVRW